MDLTQKADEDFTPVPWEDNLTYWEVLAELISSEPPFSEFRAHYGDLAELGIARGCPFQPAERMRGILTHAAVMGHAQLAAQSFADRRPDRVVWPGTQWEWAVLRPENGTFDTPDYADGRCSGYQRQGADVEFPETIFDWNLAPAQLNQLFQEPARPTGRRLWRRVACGSACRGDAEIWIRAARCPRWSWRGWPMSSGMSACGSASSS